MFNRHSIRLPHHNYSSPGFYFITICTQNKQNILSKIKNQQIQLTTFGKIVDSVWISIPTHHHIGLDTYQIMPNHIHGIIYIPPVRVLRAKPYSIQGVTRNAPTKFKFIKSGSLPCVIRSFKSETSKQIHKINPNIIVWQRNYYERIIRNEIELDKIRKYIKLNPQMWSRNRNNPNNLKN